MRNIDFKPLTHCSLRNNLCSESAYKSVRECSFKEQQECANITNSKYCVQIIRKSLVFYFYSIRLVLEHVNVRLCHDMHRSSLAENSGAGERATRQLARSSISSILTIEHSARPPREPFVIERISPPSFGASPLITWYIFLLATMRPTVTLNRRYTSWQVSTAPVAQVDRASVS